MVSISYKNGDMTSSDAMNLTQESRDSLVQQVLEERRKRQAAENEVQKLKLQVNNFVLELGNKSSMDTYRTSDEQLIKMLENLRSDIRFWSREVRKLEKPMDQRMGFNKPSKKREVFGHICSRPGDYYHEKDGRQLSSLLQAYIWWWIVHRLFRDLVWTGSVCHERRQQSPRENCPTFDVIASTMRVSDGDIRTEVFNRWRSDNARSIEQYVHIHCINRHLESEIKSIRSALGSCYLSQDEQLYFNSHTRSQEMTLESILVQAIAFDRLRWQQRARLINMPNYDEILNNIPNLVTTQIEQNFANEKSKKLTIQEQPGIELLLAPGLLKYGDSEGRRMDDYLVLMQGIVNIV